MIFFNRPFDGCALFFPIRHQLTNAARVHHRAGDDVRADLFALGAVGYFLLTGNSPFPGRTAIEVFRSERLGPPPPLARAAPNPVPAPLEETLRR